MDKNLNTTNLDLSLLDNLSPAEKELALSILKEYAEKGSSDAFNNILLEDYAETPVDILTFVDDYNYLGNAWHDAEGKSKLYPYWRKELIKLFPDNLTTTVNNAIFSGSRGRGKAQPLDSLIFTEFGYKKMGDIQIGDKVYGRDGKLHFVLGIFPQGSKPIYKVNFSDKSSVECSDEHIWHVRDNNDMVWKNIELKDIIKNGLIRGNNENKLYKECRYKIPLTDPLVYAAKEHFIDPYLMGCLLGDGCFSNNISLTTTDDEVLNYFVKELEKNNYTYTKDRISYIIKNKNSTERINKYKDEICRLGLYKHTSKDKFIPNSYIFDSIENRIALLQGLLDTDGTITKDGSNISFSSASLKLANDLVFLVQSLGGTANIRPRLNRTYRYKGEIRKCADCYTVSLKLPKNICPFRLSRKSVRLNPKRIEPQRNIKSVEYLGEKECQCIYIDSEDHLYLTDNLIVTHNTEIAVLIAAYLLHRVLCLKDPVAHFHLKPTEKLVFAFMNIKLALAEEIGIAKFQNTIQSSPWFLAHGTLEGRTKKVWVPNKFNDQQAIDIKIGSQSDDLIGLPIYFCFFDEISFIRNKNIEEQKKKANDAIDTAIGGMKTRFVHKGKNPTLLCLASSKRSDKSFLEEHMRKKLISEKDNVYISDGSVWEVKPEGTYSKETFRVGLGHKFLQSIVIPDDEPDDLYISKGYKIIKVPVDFKADFLDDIDRALCDFAGISSSSITKYINGEAVNSLITDKIQNPFVREILEIGDGNDDDRQYYNFFDISKIDPALRSKPLFIHLDMSYTGDMTGIAGVFIKGKKHSLGELDQARDLFYSLAFSVNIKAPKGRHISFEKNRNFIYWLKEKGFNIKGITSDTFQSYDTGEALRSKGYPYSVLSVDRVDPTSRVCIPYQYLRSTINEKRLEIYNDKILISELTDLERNIDTGKIDHPDGGCFTGDTKVSLVDGRRLSFLELVEEYEEGKINYVYSINPETLVIEPKKILKAWNTLKDQPLIKITFDNDESVECTLNHKFMLRNSEYIEAKDLIPGDSLMPLYTKYPSQGPLHNYRLYFDLSDNRWHFEHRKFAKKILDEKHLVHHINCNKGDNSPDNLIWMSKTAHTRVHAQMQTGACSEESKLKKAQSIKKWHAENKNTEVYLNRTNKTKESLYKYNLAKYGHNATLDWKHHIEEVENFFNVKWDNLTTSEKNSYGVKRSRIKNPRLLEETSKRNILNHKAGKYINAKKALHENNQKLKELKLLFPEIDKVKFYEFFGFEYDSVPSYQKGPWNNRYRQRLYEVINHKVKSIEFIDKKADVYDIEVEDNHNFALAAGVFVHNSKDVCDATCGAVYNASKHAEEFAYDYGEQMEDVLRLNDISKDDDVKQLTVDLENELLKMGQDRLRVHPSDADKGTEDYNLYDDIIIM